MSNFGNNVWLAKEEKQSERKVVDVSPIYTVSDKAKKAWAERGVDLVTKSTQLNDSAEIKRCRKDMLSKKDILNILRQTWCFNSSMIKLARELESREGNSVSVWIQKDVKHG